MRYFTFWFAHFANHGEPYYVNLTDREAYLFTMAAARRHGPIHEGHGLGDHVSAIYQKEIDTLA